VKREEERGGARMGWGGVGMVSVGMVGVNGEGIGWVGGWVDGCECRGESDMGYGIWDILGGVSMGVGF